VRRCVRGNIGSVYFHECGSARFGVAQRPYAIRPALVSGRTPSCRAGGAGSRHELSGGGTGLDCLWSGWASAAMSQDSRATRCDQCFSESHEGPGGCRGQVDAPWEVGRACGGAETMKGVSRWIYPQPLVYRSDGV
jgi:hypothetical protein